MEPKYNKCKPWQVYLFSIHDIVPNCFIMLMNFVSYLAVGEYAILTATASLIITASRLLDGITDPLVAVWIDRTGGKFGRYGPCMLLGYVITAVAIIAMWFLCIPGNIVTFILLYVLYIIGYTFYNTAAGGGRSVMTNEPKQRGVLGRWIGITKLIFSSVFSLYASNYIAKKHGGLGMPALQEIAVAMLVVAGVCTVLSLIALRSQDVPENYCNTTSEKVSIKDIFTTLKGNRNLQMTIIAASSDKLAQTTASNSAITIMVWGIVAGNYAFQGKLSMITLIPAIFMTFWGSRAAIRKGNKIATIQYSLLCIASALAMIALFVFGDPTQIGKSTFITVLFIVLYMIYTGGRSVTNTVVRPMISDVTDEELDRTGKYIPGIINATYTFVDKLISSLAASIVGFMLAAIGYVDSMPKIGEASTPQIFFVGMFVWLGLPILGWVCSLIAMKFYDLDPDKMEKIQASIGEKKKALLGKQ